MFIFWAIKTKHLKWAPYVNVKLELAEKLYKQKRNLKQPMILN